MRKICVPLCFNIKTISKCYLKIPLCQFSMSDIPQLYTEQSSFRSPDKWTRASRKEKVNCALWATDIKLEITEIPRRKNEVPWTAFYEWNLVSILLELGKSKRFSNHTSLEEISPLTMSVPRWWCKAGLPRKQQWANGRDETGSPWCYLLGGGVGTILRLQRRTTYKIGNTSKSETEQKLPSNF